MELLFLVEISLFIIASLDARLNIPLLPISHMLIFIIVFIIMTMHLVVDVIRAGGVVRLPKTFGVYIAILLAYVIGALGQEANTNEIIMTFMFITLIFECGVFISKYECIERFCEWCFFVPFIYLTGVIVFKQIDIVEVVRNINIVNFFSTNYFSRSRYAFEFYNPNAVGNLCACELSLFFIVLKTICIGSEQKINIKKIFFLIATTLYVITFLASGSRTAAVALIVFILLNMFFSSEMKRSTNKIYSLIMKMITILLVVVLVMLKGYDFYVNHYLGSGRYKSFSNLQMLISIKDKLLGLGLFSPGSIRNMRINGISGNTLDNFYIFCYMSTGIVGMVLIFGSLVALLIYLLHIKDVIYEKLFLCLYIELLIYGFAETSVLYYLFISDLIIVSSLFGYCNLKNNSLEKRT